MKCESQSIRSVDNYGILSIAVFILNRRNPDCSINSRKQAIAELLDNEKRVLPGKTRVLQVSFLPSSLIVRPLPPVTGALEVIGLSGRASQAGGNTVKPRQVKW